MMERLRRLLLVVPAVRARPGIPLADLAAQLACSPAELRRDIDLLACVGAPPYSPDDLIDIEVRDDRVHVSLAQSFERPARLTATEAAALAAAARTLAPQDPVLQRAVEKLSRAVAPAQRPLYEGLLARFAPAATQEPESVAAEAERAIAERRELEILYFARTELTARPRTVRPRAIAAFDGVRYLSARKPDGSERMYRMDRIARATRTDVRFEPLPPIDLAAALDATARVEARADLPRALVRFAPRVAEAARSRHPDGRSAEDGSYEVALAYTSLPWLVSYTLSWGGAADVLQPSEAREALQQAVARAVAAHTPPAA